MLETIGESSEQKKSDKRVLREKSCKIIAKSCTQKNRLAKEFHVKKVANKRKELQIKKMLQAKGGNFVREKTCERVSPEEKKCKSAAK